MRISCSQSVLFSGISIAALHVSISISDESVRPGPTARVRHTCNDQIIFSNICICCIVIISILKLSLIIWKRRHLTTYFKLDEESLFPRFPAVWNKWRVPLLGLIILSHQTRNLISLARVLSLETGGHTRRFSVTRH